MARAEKDAMELAAGEINAWETSATETQESTDILEQCLESEGGEKENDPGEGENEKGTEGGEKEDTDETSDPDSDVIVELPSTMFNPIIQSYEGPTHEDKYHGEGVAHFEEGHTYTGMFANGLMEGRGVFTWAGGLIYEGDFVRNNPMGQGTFTWPDGSFYQGQIHNGLRHGTGTYYCAQNGITYTGQWDRGQRHGKGEVFYDACKTSWYKGDWVRNTKQGQGLRRYASGNIYSGQWRRNRRNGEGTMKWVELGQEYHGMWQDGIQNGKGTHTWIQLRAAGSQYSQRNRYTGDFVQGRKHGHGAFYYASGAVYDGEWRMDKKHGLAKFTFKDGQVFEGEFDDDRMVSPDVESHRAPTPLCGSDSPSLEASITLNIECLQDRIPEKKRCTENKQVEFVILRNDTELQSIYNFYCRLGCGPSPDNTFLLTRLQLWRLLKDCRIHHHGLTLTQIDHFMTEESAPDIHCPFTTVPQRRLLSFLVVLAHHIYSESMISQQYLLASCLSKLMTDNILPHACKVKGFLFREPQISATALNYRDRCRDIYQVYTRVHEGSSKVPNLTYRHLLWMFKDLYLLDDQLTTLKLLKIIAAENHDPTNLSACLEMEITFLEFLEVLLGCALVKSEWATMVLEESRYPPEAKTLPTDVEEGRKNKATRGPRRGKKPSELESAAVPALLQNPEPSLGAERKDNSAMLMEAVDHIHHFFNKVFFPAFQHHQLVTKFMDEDKPFDKESQVKETESKESPNEETESKESPTEGTEIRESPMEETESKESPTEATVKAQ